MSDTDESAVLVDAPPAPPELVGESGATTTTVTPEKGDKGTTDKVASETVTKPSEAYQIVSIGSEEDRYAFRFDKEKLQLILNKIPRDKKVAVVSVVGAFRTGKSFLLSWFLRYLNYHKKNSNNNYQNSEKKNTTDDNDNTTEEQQQQEWYKKFQTLGKDDGFEWKGGEERNTTGIWMWNEPFFLDSNIAILLLDTQGMFDHETTMSLTASIFGFSTLLSSFQIYNVDKRIQEDNLQQLALFSEYARMAIIGIDESESNEKKEQQDDMVVPPEVEVALDGSEIVEDTAATASEAEAALESTSSQPQRQQPKKKPFQHIEFLVRDWQHFDEYEENEDYGQMEQSMSLYLDKVLEERDATDLKDTREQIVNCFDHITCYGLVHPGNIVTKKKYTGDVQSMEPIFLQLLVRYCEKVFTRVQAKTIHDHVLTGPELGNYIQAYADLFASGAKFPTAGTMLEATAKANNTNAVQTALISYKTSMNRIAGPQCSNHHYIRPEEMKSEHAQYRTMALAMYNSMANFGNPRGIDDGRIELLNEISGAYEFYESLNDGRNPLAGFELYVLPVLLAVIAFIVRWFTDVTCGASLCRAGSELLSHVYFAVFFFVVIVAATKAKQIRDNWKRLQQALTVLFNEKVKNE